MDDYKIADAMIRYGGSFVSELGKLFRYADTDNRARIKTAWPEYWQTYEDIAVWAAAREITNTGSGTKGSAT